MNQQELKRAYQAFFLKNKAGQHFVAQMSNLIEANHQSAEKQPELARDHVQAARGIRQIVNHINSVVAEAKPKDK